MLAQIENTLKQAGIRPDDPLLVGVSGGPDSLALLHSLHSLAYPLTAAHLNHGLRSGAEGDASFVREFAAGLGLHCETGFEDTPAFADQHSISIEEAARQLRYRFLFRVAQEMGAAAVLVGHTADDQVETVLMHLLRGAGLAGLRGMQVRSVNPNWDPALPLVRPLLGVSREAVLEYCREQKLAPRHDPTNLDKTFYRNRLRHELLPELETYNPRIRRLIWQMAETLDADFEVIDAAVMAAWESCQIEEGAGFVTLSRPNFLAQLKGVQRGLLRKAICRLRPGLRDIDFPAVERALAFALEPTRTKQIDLIAGLKLQVEGQLLWVAMWDAALLQPEWPHISQEYPLTLPGQTEVGFGWWLTATQVEADEAARQAAYTNQDPFSVWLDRQVVGNQVRLRTRKSGDRFEPLGMDGHSVKLSDFMINQKLPAPARAGWPLLAVGEQIAWVPGYRPASPFRVRKETETILHITFTRRTNTNA